MFELSDSDRHMSGDKTAVSKAVAVAAPTCNRATLCAAGALMKAFAGDLDVEVLDPGFATDILVGVCELEKICAAVKTLVSHRAAAASDWKAKGERSAAHWLARRTGTSVGNAATVLETGQRLASLPQTQKAFKAGQLSQVQAGHIASAAGQSPNFETKLLDAASTEGFGSFVNTCNKLRATTCQDEAERHRAIYSRRFLRKWTDATGAFRIDGAFVPEHGAQIWAAIQAYRAVVFEDARASGVKAAYDAYTADALLNMAKDARDGVLCEHPEADPGPPMDSGGAEPAGDLHRRGPGGASRRQCGVGDASGAQNGPGAGKSGYDGPRDDGLGDDRPRDDGLRDDGPRDDGRRDDKPRDDKPRDDKPPDEKSERKKRRPPPVSIDILVDYNALVRGKALPDETCEIDGIGPVPVDTVAALQNDAYLWVLVKDGCDIKSVSRMGRYISPRLRKALIARDRKCVVPGCDVRAHLQIDHVRPVADQGPTALDNLALLCVHHHMLKTHHGFVLAGKPGDWSWNGPGGPASGKG